MTTPWRMAGLTYVNYSNIAARVLRTSVKGVSREEALKRGRSIINYLYWDKGIKLGEGEMPESAKKKESN